MFNFTDEYELRAHCFNYVYFRSGITNEYRRSAAIRINSDTILYKTDTCVICGYDYTHIFVYSDTPVDFDKVELIINIITIK